MKNLPSYLIILLGVSLFAIFGYLLYLRYSSHPLTFEKIPAVQINTKIGNPEKIKIPSIGVDLPVITSKMKNNSWETTAVGVSYLSSTPVPGESGNSVMYGHNWKSLLGSLPKVKPGQKVTVTMQNGENREFRVIYTATVSPNQISIIANTQDSRLTIYTCVGFLDSKRFVVVAKPITI